MAEMITDFDPERRIELTDQELAQEEWRMVTGLPTENYYVSNFGRMKSIARVVRLGHENLGTVNKGETILKPKHEKTHRLIYVLTLFDETRLPSKKRRCTQVSRSAGWFVWNAFVGELPPLTVVRHSDGDTYNPRLGNLYLQTRAQLARENLPTLNVGRKRA